MITIALATFSCLVWLGIVLAANDLRSPPTREFWRLLVLAALLNALALAYRHF